ncbi:MAG: UDP-N-acetylmuramate--L-alanine ligase [Alphaproteobacteria bacterium]|nr:UDP-N-acetylmuramate--L-alanine ligase [Alphaproteobacteria bacterium]
MKTFPQDIGSLHFIGIGGIGMSGIAEILHNLGYRVQGSDLAENYNVRRLQQLGIPIMLGHKSDNIKGAKVVVISSAVKSDNPEFVAARDNFIPIVKRAEMLAELMRLKWSIAVAGTHGKTTTTSLVASLLDAGHLDPTVVNGGIINNYGTNARLGKGEWIVVEADESDGTFVKLPATIAVVTNIDPEHLDHYGSIELMHKAFENFITNIPFYGCATLCTDHPIVQTMIPKVQGKRIITYGMNSQADIRAIDIETKSNGSIFDVIFADHLKNGGKRLKKLHLPMIGMHNVQNALAAIAIANELDIKEESIYEGLSKFGGVKRRFTKTGEINGITIIDDYGHHPVEISAVLRAAKTAADGRVIAVVQPHRYTRLKDLFEEFCTCFNDADHVIVADIYAAGEQPIPNINRDYLIEGLRAHGLRHVDALNSPEALAPLINQLAQKGDMVVCLGAGSITNWAYALPDQLKILYNSSKKN